MKKEKQEGYVASVCFVFAYIGLGDKEEALRHLKDSHEEHEHWMVWLDSLPIFDSLRSELRFKKIVEEMNFPKNQQVAP